MKTRSGLILLFSLIVFASFAQMTDNGVTKYGNEWIVPGREYYKIRISKDGFYKIDFNALKASGIDGEIVGSQLRLFRNGVEIPITVSANGQWSDSDFLTFHGYYNKSEMDKYSFPNGVNDIVNPKASLYSDTATYFLTINPDGNNLRTNILPNNLINPPSPEPYIIRISEMDFREILNTKTEYVGQHPFVNTPFYPGKGMVTSADNQTYKLSCPGLLPDSRLPIFRYRGITNAGNVGVNLGHDLKFSMKGQQMYSVFSTGQRVMYVNFTYVDTNRVITASDNQYSLTNGHPLDLIKTGYVAIEYPSDLNIDATRTQSFFLEGKASDRLLDFIASGDVPTAPYLTDSLGTWRIPGSVTGNTIRFRIPAFTVTSRLIYRPGDDAESISSMTQVKMKDFNNLNADYIILSHNLLMEDNNGPSAVEQYAAYRRSAAGGAYDVEVVNVSDLYNSFGYGLDYNPMAIKNFANFIGLKGSSRFLFIIGRGRDYKEIRSNNQLATAISKGYGVPTFGDFGSDNLLVSKSFHKVDMNLAVGRLPAVTQDEVITYLNKIRASDAAYNAPGDNSSRQWTKTIVQVNGGNIGKPDQAAISNAQKDVEALIKSSKLAGFVETFVKGSNETIGKASDDFFKLVNQGVAVVDYFGHGALSTLEYPIDLPSKYSNSPRLPILIIKGCKTGNCQRDGSSYPSKLLYEESYKNSGYRAVIGSISDSELYSLSMLAHRFYTLWGGDMYGKTFGELFQATFNSPGLNNSQEGIQQLYVGDPALMVQPFPGPDFTILPGEVKTIPENIASTDNAFTVQFTVKNLGTSVEDTLFYRVTYENGDKKVVSVDSSFIYRPNSENVIYAEFQLDKTSTSGENTIYITLDPKNKISESPAPIAELNNDYINPGGSKGYKFYI
ncbi:MAG TPA: C25 family cysteine peptidase, partial [Saprospiraceae bacterium]|nr:C25 family cysteine peptidase [Saprospiraceae bacterium]HNB92860.1 C25 family cysteine peptidase [Saprospiraceae bacterium]HNP11467.1 C25 family cysteine peptidase [Saprospiraceae bacterium]HNU17820.1 C25 family cysteine peptidase [Saprospiraceae bacterium]